MIILKNTEPVAEGRQRYVFNHPGDPDLLIKVIRPDAISRAWGEWYKCRRSSRQYLSYMREIGEYVTSHARDGANPSFAQQIVGFAETDMGLGLVLRAVRGKNGELAPSLRSMLANDTFDPAAREALELFFHDLLASHIIAADLHSGNLVYAYDQERGHHFVMIDGLGQHNLIPIKRFSSALNRRGNKRRIEKLRQQITKAGRPSKPSRFSRRTRKRLRNAALAIAALAAFPLFLHFRSDAPSKTARQFPQPSSSPALAAHLPATSKVLQDGSLSAPWIIRLANGTVVRAQDATATDGTVIFGGRISLEKIPSMKLSGTLQLLLSPDGEMRILGNPFPALIEQDEDMITFQDDIEEVIQ